MLLKRIGKGLLIVLAILAVLGVWKREQIERLYRVNTLFAADRIVGNFSSMDRMFLTAPVSRGTAPVRELPRAERPLPEKFTHGGGEETVESYLERSATTSLLVLKDGVIMHESYRLGTGPEDLRISWSMAKSMVSALIGIALAEGRIASIDDPAERYAPELAQGAYKGVSIRDLLHMASGVEFDEDYGDFNSDINQMGRVLALGGSMDAFAAGQDRRVAPAGENFRYVSIDTHALAMTLRGAVGKSLPDYLSEKLYGPMGAEADALFITDGEGVAFALGGMNARTRDYARFGLLIAEGGAWNGAQIVPADWIVDSTAQSAPPPAEPRADRHGYGYQWWIPPEPEGPEGKREVLARGVYSQFIYIRPADRIVIVKTSADRGFMDRSRRANLESTRFFRAVAQAYR